MKKGISFALIFILLTLSISFASAGFFDWFKSTITGRAVEEEFSSSVVYESEIRDDSTLYLALEAPYNHFNLSSNEYVGEQEIITPMTGEMFLVMAGRLKDPTNNSKNKFLYMNWTGGESLSFSNYQNYEIQDGDVLSYYVFDTKEEGCGMEIEFKNKQNLSESATDQNNISVLNANPRAYGQWYERRIDLSDFKRETIDKIMFVQENDVIDSKYFTEGTNNGFFRCFFDDIRIERKSGGQPGTSEEVKGVYVFIDDVFIDDFERLQKNTEIIYFDVEGDKEVLDFGEIPRSIYGENYELTDMELLKDGSGGYHLEKSGWFSSQGFGNAPALNFYFDEQDYSEIKAFQIAYDEKGNFDGVYLLRKSGKIHIVKDQAENINGTWAFTEGYDYSNSAWETTKDFFVLKNNSGAYVLTTAGTLHPVGNVNPLDITNLGWSPDIIAMQPSYDQNGVFRGIYFMHPIGSTAFVDTQGNVYPDAPKTTGPFVNFSQWWNLGNDIIDFEVTPDNQGAYVLDNAGNVFASGTAPELTGFQSDEGIFNFQIAYTTSETPGPECVTKNDCRENQECVGGVCVYIQPFVPGQMCEYSSEKGLGVRPGIRLKQGNQLKFCDPEELILVEVKDNEESCNNDYECLSNVCIDGECTSIADELREQTTLLQRIWCWIKNPLNSDGYDSCLASARSSCKGNVCTLYEGGSLTINGKEVSLASIDPKGVKFNVKDVQPTALFRINDTLPVRGLNITVLSFTSSAESENRVEFSYELLSRGN